MVIQRQYAIPQYISLGIIGSRYSYIYCEGALRTRQRAVRYASSEGFPGRVGDVTAVPTIDALHTADGNRWWMGITIFTISPDRTSAGHLQFAKHK